MRVFEVLFDEVRDKGVSVLGLVENPAMEDQWIKLSEQKQEIQFTAVDTEKRILLGAVLIPDKKIYRKVNENEFYITFQKQTIEKLAHAFMIEGNQHNTNENHDIALQGMTVVENWVVEDSEKDKSALHGKNYPVGTWVAMMKVNDENTWQKAKSGKLTGYSIEAMLKTREINFKDQIDMSTENKTFLEKMEAKLDLFLEKLTPKEIKMGEVLLKDGKTKLFFEGDAPEVGKAVFVLSEDGEEKYPAPKGEIELESGEMLSVDENGMIAVEDKKPKVEEPKKEDSKEMEQKLEAMIDAKLSKVQAENKKALEAKDAKIAELELKLQETPAAKKISKTGKEDQAQIMKLSVEGKTRKERLYNRMLLRQN